MGSQVVALNFLEIHLLGEDDVENETGLFRKLWKETRGTPRKTKERNRRNSSPTKFSLAGGFSPTPLKNMRKSSNWESFPQGIGVKIQKNLCNYHLPAPSKGCRP